MERSHKIVNDIDTLGIKKNEEEVFPNPNREHKDF